MPPDAPFTNEYDAISYVFESLANFDWQNRGLDEHTRSTAPTEHLLNLTQLPGKRREYTVITGTKGKGSVAAVTAKILQSLGHKVGLLTSPHLTTYRQRFRINGRMIEETTMLALLDELKPSIEAVRSTLNEGQQYLSPQGIFLTMALKWFDEENVTAAVIEVGRGGRFDDNALVPNMLSMFTPIMLEHTRYLGDTVERIAWHKAGIIKPRSYAYSLPQTPEVMAVLQKEAELKESEFSWLAPADAGRYLGPVEGGQRVDMGRYGEVVLPMLGRYEIQNAGLAVWGAGNMHARLSREDGVDVPSHGSQEYVDRVRDALQNVVWPGRCQKLQDNPAVYIDGAINVVSAELFIESVRDRLTQPVVALLAVPTDRDYDAVYRLFGEISDAFVLTQTERNITIHFPDEATALAAASPYSDDVQYQPDIPSAIDAAIQRAGQDGTVLMSVAQPAVGDAMAYYGLLYEQI